MKEAIRMMCVATIVAGLVSSAMAVDIETVTVGNPGNAGELSGKGAGGRGIDSICGPVDYRYNVGKYEVTAGQYCQFLNVSAAIDTYGLYDERMDTDSGLTNSQFGCNIKRSGSPGTYTYSVETDWANRPLNWVSWGDAARFANWLHNGQPTGAQDSTTTEDGAYDLTGTHPYYNPDGTVNDREGLRTALLAVSRKPDWKWAITSENEWYKAAYYNPATGTYYDYPTGSDTAPDNDVIDPDPGNNATSWGDDHYTIGSPYWRTEAGEHENSDSPYGTFDQGGNVWEWNEAVIGLSRGIRSGTFTDSADNQLASWRGDCDAVAYESDNIGFRVSEVPEPTTLSLLALSGLALIRRRKHGMFK